MSIIQEVHDWLGNSGPEKKNLLWLRGAAGVGKSAIVQTLAETLAQNERLGASIFFSKSNGRSNPRQVLRTLAYRFAVQDPSYREYITQIMRNDPVSLNKAMNEQFRILFVEPFIHRKIRSASGAWVIALDGLDECGGDSNNKYHSDRIQCDIIRLISGFVRQYPAAPLIWIIASRPEPHLKAVFSEPDVLPSFWEEEVPVDSVEACEDVDKFLRKEFTKIRENYPYHIRESSWPNNKQFLEIAHAALGLFIFAQVVVRFIDDPKVGNPIAQLEYVILAISQIRSKNTRENPFANLDAMYIAILSKIPSDTLQITKRLLGFLIFLNSKDIRVSDCNLRLIRNILDISGDATVTALRHLHSLLYIPKVKDISQTRPRFYHASFRDFLRDGLRSHEYFADTPAIVDEIFQGTARVAQAQFSSSRSRYFQVYNNLSELSRLTITVLT